MAEEAAKLSKPVDLLHHSDHSRNVTDKHQIINGDPRTSILRHALPACQPQEGSIGSRVNAFTQSELAELKAALPSVELGPRHAGSLSHIGSSTTAGSRMLNICQPWETTLQHQSSKNDSGGSTATSLQLDYYGVPRFASRNTDEPRHLRRLCRDGLYTGPTNGQCPGFLQCNLVVLPEGQHAFDFLLFCQRNPKACPLIEVCDVGSYHPVGVALGADLRTDLPRYAIYRNGKLEKETTDVVEEWPERSVAFLIGCSFSYDGSFLEAGIPLRSAEQAKNVPMYKTTLKCRPAGSLQGCMVVSMKPIPALQVANEVEITSKFMHAHGGPVSIGRADIIGIHDIDSPDWGDAIAVGPDEVPVFHACGVTPQSVLMDSNVPFAITHSAGHMFVTDLPADMRNL
ncbi:hypothetical protein MPSEU_000563200 [Mayamaea pseudoterrestris]|nr:hypothetical protein MPSEU_000563200 [Mayamaea pseudoterrestris]